MKSLTLLFLLAMGGYGWGQGVHVDLSNANADSGGNTFAASSCSDIISFHHSTKIIREIFREECAAGTGTVTGDTRNLLLPIMPTTTASGTVYGAAGATGEPKWQILTPPLPSNCRIERYVSGGAALAIPITVGWHEAKDLRINCDPEKKKSPD